jgi:hypothetical protein
MEALLQWERLKVIFAQIEPAGRLAPPSRSLPHKGGGNGKRCDERYAVRLSNDVLPNLRLHDAPPSRNSFACTPSGAWVAAMIRPPRAR